MNRQDQCVIRFLEAVSHVGLPMPEFERQFWAERDFRFDFCWPDRMVAVELEGQAHKANGYHTNVIGYNKDILKYNKAAILGWTVLRITPKMIDKGEILPLLKEAFYIEE